jgi:hypothetical protein
MVIVGTRLSLHHNPAYLTSAHGERVNEAAVNFVYFVGFVVTPFP